MSEPLRMYRWIVVTIFALFFLYNALKLVYVICDALLPTYPVLGAPRGLEVFIQLTLIMWALYTIRIWILFKAVSADINQYRWQRSQNKFAYYYHESID